MRIQLSLYFLVLFVPLSCGTEAFSPNFELTGEYGYDFQESKKQWLKLRGQNDNTYVYTVSEQSSSGFGSETTIRVVKGEVMARSFVAFVISENDGSKEITHSYEEDKSNLGTHEEGAAPVPMEQLYADCGLDYLMVDPETHIIYFDTDETGVVSLCGNVPELCADDCFQGFRISEFRWGE